MEFDRQSMQYFKTLALEKFLITKITLKNQSRSLQSQSTVSTVLSGDKVTT